MATFIPNYVEDFNNSYGEMEIFDKLKLLPNDYYIFHSFEWINGARGETQGEADFVIFHPDKGIAVIEVKGGIIECNERRWFQTNSYTLERKEIFDPLSQASKSKFKLIELLRKYLPRREQCIVCHGVWFPTAQFITKELPANYSREIIMDKNSFSDPQHSIDQVFMYWNSIFKIKTNLTALGVRKVIDILAPRFSAVPSIRATVNQREKWFVRLTKEQTNVLDFLDEQRTAAIHGSAGTGKTVIAIEKARRLSEKGGNVLFLCYNSLLRTFLKKNHSIPRVDYHNIHSLALTCIENKDAPLDLLPSLLEEWLTDPYRDEADWPYDHVVIDEGQDLDYDLVNYLLLQTKGSFYVFYDRNQLIQSRTLPDWINELECRLVLKKNCRNTAEIYRTSCSTVGFRVPLNESALRGDKPSIIFSTTKNETIDKLEKRIKMYVEDWEFNPSDIVILSANSENHSVLYEQRSILNIPLVSDFEEEGILFTTVRKFKGLEAKVIILIDVTKETFIDENGKRLFYVGGSRARHNLDLVFQTYNGKDITEVVQSLAGKRRIPKNYNGLTRILGVEMIN